MDQKESLPDFRKEYHWESSSSVPGQILNESKIRVYSNPCTDREDKRRRHQAWAPD